MPNDVTDTTGLEYALTVISFAALRVANECIDEASDHLDKGNTVAMEGARMQAKIAKTIAAIAKRAADEMRTDVEE